MHYAENRLGGQLSVEVDCEWQVPVLIVPKGDPALHCDSSQFFYWIEWRRYRRDVCRVHWLPYLNCFVSASASVSLTSQHEPVSFPFFTYVFITWNLSFVFGCQLFTSLIVSLSDLLIALRSVRAVHCGCGRFIVSSFVRRRLCVVRDGVSLPLRQNVKWPPCSTPIHLPRSEHR